MWLGQIINWSNNMTTKSLTQDKLKGLLNYNPETGIFTRAVDSGRNNCWKKGSVSGYFDASNGYVKVSLLGKRYYAHRLAWLYVHGKFPENKIDHINHNRTDNRLCNLRTVSNTDNSRNCSKQANNTSGTTGVVWDRDLLKWSARIMVNRKCLYLGVFVDIELAKNARKQAEVKYGFHKNHGV